MENKQETKFNQNVTSEIISIKQDNKFHKFDSNTDLLIAPKYILVLISEFAWFLIIAFIVLSSFYFQYYHPAQIFTSKPKTKWNSDYIPLIFTHITDIHLSSFLKYKTDGSLIFLYEFFSKYKPDFILNSGDVVDNYESSFWPKVGSQNEEDWEIYNRTLKKELDKYYVIDVAGNHDVFAVDGLFSEHNYFLDFSYMFKRKDIKTMDDFIIKKHVYKNLTFILFNDYILPTPHPPYGLTPHPTRHMLDLLENMIDSVDECIILTHYQSDRNWFRTSSKGNNYMDIISKKNVLAIFTGHYHPIKPMIIHHGKGAIEFCTSSPFNHKIQGILTYDNNQLVYHKVFIPYPTKGTDFFMTYPVPNRQCSNHHNFNYDTSEVRVISYKKNVNLFIEGDLNGKLKFKTKLNNGAELYTFPINLKEGIYKIHVYGDGCNITTEFTIGDTCEGVPELSVRHPRGFLVLRFSSIPVIIALYIIIFPYYFRNLKLAEDIESYIEGKGNKPNYFWFYLILLGPFISRVRYMKVNKNCRIIFFLLTLYPLLLPNHLFKNIYGMKGFSFNVFIVTGSRLQFEDWALQMTYVFYGGVALQNAFYLSALKYYDFKTKDNIIIFLFNFIFTNAFYGFVQFINIRYVGESIKWPYLIITPSFCIIWIIIKILIHKYAYIESKN